MQVIKRIITFPLKLLKFFYWETTIEIVYYLFTGKEKDYKDIKGARKK